MKLIEKNGVFITNEESLFVGDHCKVTRVKKMSRFVAATCHKRRTMASPAFGLERRGASVVLPSHLLPC